MKIEIIVHDRIGNFVSGQIVEVEDGPFLRAMLRGGKASVLNPPDWELENADTYEASKAEKIKTPRKKKTTKILGEPQEKITNEEF